MYCLSKRQKDSERTQWIQLRIKVFERSAAAATLSAFSKAPWSSVH